MNSMIFQSCDVNAVGVMNATNAHDMARMRYLASVHSKERMVIAYLNDMMMKVNLYRDKDTHKRYAEEEVSVFAKLFET